MMFDLAIVGFCYGATIAAYPAVVSVIFGSAHGVKIYGRIFTAWGIAGLVGPILAGFLYQFSGNYQFTLIIAGCASLVLLDIANGKSCNVELTKSLLY